MKSFPNEAADSPNNLAVRVGTDPIKPRAERTYFVEMEAEGGGDETIEIVIPTGNEETQDQQAHKAAKQAVEKWAAEGDWGADGASISVWYTLSDDKYEWPRACVTVDIEPDHETLIREAVCQSRGNYASHADYCGDAPDDHEWTSEGHGGCDENPGVWSTGGTSMAFSSHCVRCGLRRGETTTGTQRNPGEHDTVAYDMPERWCSEHQTDDDDHRHDEGNDD
jgi:hypothetical protein